MLSLGGASGSPVFLAESGHVIGILNSGLIEARPTFSVVGNQLQVTGFTQGATNFTYVVPAYYIASAMRNIVARDKQFALPSDTPSLTEIIARSSVTRREGSGQIRPLPDKGDSPTIFDVHMEPVSFT
jgi:hypothetical protein